MYVVDCCIAPLNHEIPELTKSLPSALQLTAQNWMEDSKYQRERRKINHETIAENWPIQTSGFIKHNNSSLLNSNQVVEYKKTPLIVL